MEMDILDAVSLSSALIGMVVVVFFARRKRWAPSTILGNISPFVGLAALALAGSFSAVSAVPLVGLGVFVVSFGVFAHFLRVGKPVTEGHPSIPRKSGGHEDPAPKALLEVQLADLRDERRALRWKMAVAVLTASILALTMGILTGDFLMGVITAGVACTLTAGFVAYSSSPVLGPGDPSRPNETQLPPPDPVSHLDSSTLEFGEGEPNRETSDASRWGLTGIQRSASLTQGPREPPKPGRA